MHIPSLNFALGETIDMLRDAVRDFAENEIAPRDAKLYEIGAGTSEIRRMLIGRELMAETC